MSHRKLLTALTLFNATANTLYLVRFFGIFPPKEVVYGYIPWFMSFTLPNIFIAMLSWFLAVSLLRKNYKSAALFGLIVSGALILHALNGLSFGFYTGFLRTISLNATIEIVVYVFGLSLAAFYITQFRGVIRKALHQIS